MKEEKEQAQPVMIGRFPIQRFFDTLAAILSRKENMKITVKVAVLDE